MRVLPLNARAHVANLTPAKKTLAKRLVFLLSSFSFLSICSAASSSE